MNVPLCYMERSTKTMLQRTETEASLMRALAEIRKNKRRKALQKAQKKYHERCFAVVSTKIKKADSNRFIELCNAENMTRHEVLRIYIERANDHNNVFFWE